MINISENAAEKIKLSLKDQGSDIKLRVAVMRKDNEYHYAMGLEDNITENDKSFSVSGINIVISSVSEPLAKDMTIDYVTMDDGNESFIFINPNDPNHVEPKENKVSEKDFLESLKDWATSIMSGDLSARIEILKNSHNKDIAENLNAVTDMFEAQLIKNNEQLERFTEYEKEKNKILIIEERFKIASELHDSLAQTLASLKIQARVLDESIHQGDDSQMWNELEKLEDSIHKANAEIRELIKQFRTGPKATKNFITELENLIDSFKKENSSIKIFLQIEDKKVNLSDDQSRNTLKIIQEAITNVVKHSQAKIVRLFVSKEKDNTVNVLVEDDGIGIAKSCFIGHEEEVSGEHFGISVMKDRANQMNARLDIESEPGEGVRIKLNIPLN